MPLRAKLRMRIFLNAIDASGVRSRQSAAHPHVDADRRATMGLTELGDGAGEIREGRVSRQGENERAAFELGRYPMLRRVPVLADPHRLLLLDLGGCFDFPEAGK
jgi:hypothetical protein